MTRLVLAVLLALPLPAAGGGADVAEELLGAARRSLGGDALARVGGLRLTGELTRLSGESETTTGEVEVDLQRDGRYRRLETVSPVPGLPSVTIGFGFDGRQGWVGPLGGPSAGPVVVRTGDAEAPGADERLRQRLSSEAARLVAALLLASPGTCPLEYRAAGVAEAADGKADVLDVEGTCGLEARLFLDSSSHRPVMVEYSGSVPRMLTRTATGAEAGAAAAPAPAPSPVRQLRLHLGEYREVKGVALPHRLSTEADGRTFEEWVVERWTFDPKVGDDHFRKPR